jgi:nicotinic acid mononucleotide adenylyltransferase
MSSTPVVCTYQGAFGPPHLGHQGAAARIAEKLLKLYPGRPITVLFMPTSNVSSKPSLSKKTASGTTGSNASPYISEKERKAILDMYSSVLNTEFEGRGVTFETSEIEYELGPSKGTATIHTLVKLHEIYPDATLVLAMGRDNGLQFPWWADVQEYSKYIDSILVVDRKENRFNTGVNFIGTSIPIEFEEQAPWAIKLNKNDSEKDEYKASKIFESDNEVSRAMRSLISKMYLIDAPLDTSSTNVRKALAKDKNVSGIVGLQAAEYLLKTLIGKRSKDEVKGQVEQLGGRGRKTRAKKMKSKRGSKGTRKH